MRLVPDILRAYGAAIREALPLLIVITIILDALLLRTIEPAPPLAIAGWFGVYFATTLFVVTAIYTFWLYISRVVSSTSAGERDRTLQ